MAEEDLEYDAGTFTVRGAPDKAKTIPELAFSGWTAHNLPDGMEPGFEETAVYDPANFVFPYGAHICVVEVDTETGKVDVVKYVAVDDVGTVINPQIVDGQVMGGVIQGIAEAIFEEAVYDENGQLLTPSMTAYEIPAASDVPAVTLGRGPGLPSNTNELGVLKVLGSTRFDLVRAQRRPGWIAMGTGRGRTCKLLDWSFYVLGWPNISAAAAAISSGGTSRIF